MFLIMFILILTLDACKSDKVQGPAIDQLLYEMSNSPEGFIWYKHSEDLLEKSSGSGHPQPFLRTRFNAVAATQLGSDGKVINGSVFPEGSLIVKELFDDSSTLGRYGILYKKSNHPNADSKGWVWGYINGNGSVAISAVEKGSSCISCHSQTENIDYVLMNKYFP
jgi:hypothetical protein